MDDSAVGEGGCEEVVGAPVQAALGENDLRAASEEDWEVAALGSSGTMSEGRLDTLYGELSVAVICNGMVVHRNGP